MRRLYSFPTLLSQRYAPLCAVRWHDFATYDMCSLPSPNNKLENRPWHAHTGNIIPHAGIDIMGEQHSTIFYSSVLE